MATLLVPPPTSMTSEAPMPALDLYRMPYAVYEQIANREILRSSDHVILLDGLLVNSMSKGPRHRNGVLRGQAAIRAVLAAGWVVWAEQPIDLRNGPHGDSAPEPDLAVIFGSIERYETRHPVGSEVGMVIEVASDSDALRIDRAGLFRYAYAGIPITCILNLADRSIEVYTEPSGPTNSPNYKTCDILRPGQLLAGDIGTATTGPAAIAPIPVEAFFAPV